MTPDLQPTTGRPARAWPLIKRFWPWTRPHRSYILWITLFLVLSTPVAVVSPLIVRRLIDGAADRLASREIVLWGAALIGLNILSLAFDLAAGYARTLFHNKVQCDLRLNLYLHMQRLSLREYRDKGTGYLLSRQVDDVGNLQGVMTDGFARAAVDALLALIYAGLLFSLEWRLATGALALVVVLLGFQVVISNEVRRRTRHERERWTDVVRNLHQSLAGQYLVRATASEEREASLFDRLLRSSLHANLAKELFLLITGRLFGLLGSLATTLIILSGVYLISQGQFSTGGLFAFFMYLGQMFAAVLSVAQLNPAMQTSLASLERIYEVLDSAPESARTGKGVRPAAMRGEVIFEGVSFAYDLGNLVLHDIDLTLPARQTIALVGPSGSGKSTLAHLLPRFYDPTAGRVLIDGHALTDLDPHWLRRHIGMVPQQVFLFDRSIADNIAYGCPDASHDEIRAAARAACALDFIEALPEGFDTRVGEGGGKLSGGQRQRLAIAREILSDPAILILDEATSALDSETEGLIQRALEPLFAGRTALVIAHRLATVVKADRIVVLDGGRIVEQGPHHELIEAGGLYSRLYHSQFLPASRA